MSFRILHAVALLASQKSLIPELLPSFVEVKPCAIRNITSWQSQINIWRTCRQNLLYIHVESNLSLVPVRLWSRSSPTKRLGTFLVMSSNHPCNHTGCIYFASILQGWQPFQQSRDLEHPGLRYVNFALYSMWSSCICCLAKYNINCEK